MRLCNGRTHSGGICRQPALPYQTRCYIHAGRPPGTPQHPNTRAAAVEGRRRWLAKMRLAKAHGLIEKIPGGRKLGVRGRVRSPAPREARLERAAEKAIEMALKVLPVPLDKPPEEMTDAELFAGNFRESLLFNRAVLRQPIDLSDPNPEMLKTKREVALATQTAAVRIKVAELAPRADDSVVERLMRRVAAIRRGEKVIELDPNAKTVEPTG